MYFWFAFKERDHHDRLRSVGIVNTESEEIAAMREISL